MKKLLPLLLCLCLCGCTALPTEERAFAVVLAVEHPGPWRVHARIPTYQTGGGYMTINGKGDTLDAALADLDARAPMHLHLSQLRLLVLDDALGRTEDLMQTLRTLSARPDMRLQAAVAVTDGEVSALMEAMEPATGSRLSKSLDVLRETRVAQGAIPDGSLADILRMGERQTPVLVGIMRTEDAPDLLGGWPLTVEGRLASYLDETQMQLLSVMQGQTRTLRLTLPGASAALRDASARAKLRGTTASLQLTARAISANATTEGLEAALADVCLTLLERLTRAGCDPLGLGRQGVRSAKDMAAWHASPWGERLQGLLWMVEVGVSSGT